MGLHLVPSALSEALAQLMAVAEDKNTSQENLEGAHNLLIEDVLQALYRNNRQSAGMLAKSIQTCSDRMTVCLAQESEQSPLFHLGRVVGMLELLRAAMERMIPPDVLHMLQHKGGWKVLAILQKEPRPLSVDALASKASCEKEEMVKLLHVMAFFGHILLRGHSLDTYVASIAPLGLEALAAQPPEAAKA
ncbi:MAG: hypothetical protein WCV84_01510 [Patescibacteria group bacterium]